MWENKLSNRMKAVASMVDEGYVADIGCDHAFVSIYLIKMGIANKVIAMDVKKGPVNIARENIRLCGLENVIEVRLSDGLQKLSEYEAECAIIAGMGGGLIQRILMEGKKHINNGIHLILQPQSEPWRLREYLYNIGYIIIDEKMLMEEGKYYVLMKAVPADIPCEQYSKEELYFGRLLLKQKDSVLEDYIRHNVSKKIELIDNLEHIHTEKSEKRLHSLRSEINFMENALSKYY